MQKRSAFEQLAGLKIPKKEKQAWAAFFVALAFIIVWLVLHFS